MQIKQNKTKLDNINYNQKLWMTTGQVPNILTLACLSKLIPIPIPILLKKAKPILRSLYFYCFPHFVIVLLFRDIASLYFYFHIDFVPHNPKIADQGFFFQLLIFAMRLASYNCTSVVLLQHFLILLPFFFSQIF